VTVHAPPPVAPPERDELEALIREARARQQRRRRLLTLAVVVLAAAAIPFLYVGLRGNASASASHDRPGSRNGASAGATVVPKEPAGLAIAANGDLLVIDDDRNQILERLPDGAFRVFAGTGKLGFSGDGGPAVDAELSRPSALAVGADGSVYVADTGNNRVRRIAPDGTIGTIAGNGKHGWVRGGEPALSAPVESPDALAFDRRGRLYVTAGGYGEVLRLNGDGTLTRIAGVRGPEGVWGLGRRAAAVSVDGADGLAFDRAGDLYLAGFNTKTLLMVDRHGIMRAPLGTGTGFYPRGPGGLVTDPGGHVIAMDTQRIVELGRHAERTLYNFDGKKVAHVRNFLPDGLAVSRHGVVYTDTFYGNGWASGSAILELDIVRGQARILWSHHGS